MIHLLRASSPRLALAFASLVLAACSGSNSSVAPVDASTDGPGVHSTDDARRAYLGLDASVDKAITLGFQGFNAATNANIPTQQTTGDASGTMSIGGQVDQGQSSNKTMRLTDTLTAYSDDGTTAYDSSGSPGALTMMLTKIPTGTLSGTLDGTFVMSPAPDAGAATADAGAALVGNVTLALTFTGDLEADPSDASKVQRKPGTTHITGTASAGGFTFQVDVTR